MCRIGVLVCFVSLLVGCGLGRNNDSQTDGFGGGKGDFLGDACRGAQLCADVTDFVSDCLSPEHTVTDCVHFFEDGAVESDVFETVYACCAAEIPDVDFCIGLGTSANDSLCDNIDVFIDECKNNGSSLDDCVDFYQEGPGDSNAHQDLTDCCEVSNATYPWCPAVGVAPLVHTDCYEQDEQDCQDASSCNDMDTFVLDCVSDEHSPVDCLHFFEDGAIGINVFDTAYSCCAAEISDLSFCVPLGPSPIDSMCDNIDTVIDECILGGASLDDCIGFFQEGADNSNAVQDLIDCCDVSNATDVWCAAMDIPALIQTSCPQ